MIRTITAMIDFPEDVNIPEAYQTIYNCISDLGEVSDLVIKTPVRDYTKFSASHLVRVLRKNKRKKRNQSWYYYCWTDFEQITAGLAPPATQIREYLDWLTSEGKIEHRIQDGYDEWKMLGRPS